MSKSRLGIMVVLISLATSITFAQSFFSSAPQTQTSPQKGASGTPSKPMSPDDFKNLVQQQGKQAQQSVQQQVEQSYSKQPFQPPAAPTGSQPGSQPTTPTVVVPPAPTDDTDTSNNPSAQPDQSQQGASTPNTNSNGSSSGSGSQKSGGWNIKY